MKRVFLFLVLCIIFFASAAIGEQAVDWAAAPVITTAYELSEGKLYLEWTGSSPVYQVYMDGKSVADVIVNNAIISVEKGTHSITVYPINEEKSADTKIEVGLDGDASISLGKTGKGISIPGINGNISLDLAALGLDPKKLTAGAPSETLNIDYVPNGMFSAVPDKPTATIDFSNNVILTFTDRYNADEYVVAVKAGKDVNYVKFNKHSEEASALITKNNTTVTVVLDQNFLQAQGCMLPELDNKYTFTVQLRKYAANLMDDTPITSVIHESKESSGAVYTPIAAWKTAPVVTYASQTADGQVTLQWTHNDNGLGCKYTVVKQNKKLGVKIGEEEIGTTAERTFVIDDLMNGNHSFAIVPKYNNEVGSASEDATIEIQNDWVVAPTLTCEQIATNQVKLNWATVEGVTGYHLKISKGDNTSILRFVNMDFSDYTEIDIDATAGPSEYIFTYEGDIDPVNGEKFKFEIYGVHIATNGQEQHTSTTSQIITIK